MVRFSVWRYPALMCFAVPALAQPVQVSVVSTKALLLPPGVAIIRDSAHWDLLWRRYRSSWLVPGDTAGPNILPVDFTRDMIFVVSMRVSCSMAGFSIGGVRRVGDTIRVTIGADTATPPEKPDPFGDGIVCQPPIVASAVRMPASDARVDWRMGFVRSERLPYPPPAQWWQYVPNDATALLQNGVALRGVVRDPETPTHLIMNVIDGLRAAYVDPNVERNIDEFMLRPDVYRNPQLLRMLFALGANSAADSIFARHGEGLAGDSTTSPDLITILVGRLGRPFPNRVRVAEALLTNPVVREDRFKMSILLNAVTHDARVFAIACEAYYAHPWRRVHFADGSECPGIPPLPSPRDR